MLIAVVPPFDIEALTSKLRSASEEVKFDVQVICASAIKTIFVLSSNFNSYE